MDIRVSCCSEAAPPCDRALSLEVGMRLATCPPDPTVPHRIEAVPGRLSCGDAALVPMSTTWRAACAWRLASSLTSRLGARRSFGLAGVHLCAFCRCLRVPDTACAFPARAVPRCAPVDCPAAQYGFCRIGHNPTRARRNG